MSTPSVEIEAVKELVNAKFDAHAGQMARMEKVLDRVVIAIEHQAKSNEALAVLTERVSHIDDTLNNHKTAVNAALVSHGKRISKVEGTSAETKWRLKNWHAVAAAAVSGVFAVITHYEAIIKFFHG